MRLEIETYCNVYMWDQLQLIHGPALFDSFSVLRKKPSKIFTVRHMSVGPIIAEAVL